MKLFEFIYFGQKLLFAWRNFEVAKIKFARSFEVENTF